MTCLDNKLGMVIQDILQGIGHSHSILDMDILEDIDLQDNILGKSLLDSQKDTYLKDSTQDMEFEDMVLDICLQGSSLDTESQDTQVDISHPDSK
ncbi:hypothetical protein E2C01_016115 [Portunus trituberculatus]|uniref:Uncharacterized protein n=1 Tax=Portunus trituberculatus TaxID=210409 RepID=A0A5B7DPP1_PORTR|nr:hypothetical protein [Portunus trituberculatus]